MGLSFFYSFLFKLKIFILHVRRIDLIEIENFNFQVYTRRYVQADTQILVQI